MESPQQDHPTFRPHPGLTLLDQGRAGLRAYRYASRPEQTDGHWLWRSLQYVGGKPPANRLGTTAVERLLSHLATAGQVSAAPPRQALHALAFLDRAVLPQPLERTIAPVRRQRRPRPPPVLPQAEVQRLLAAMTGRHARMARLRDGGGLRLLEGIRLRLQDVDVGQHRLVVRGGKGGPDRTPLRPRHLRDALPAQSEAVQALQHQDLEEAGGAVYLPEALARQAPKAARETGWQWGFPARARARAPRSGRERRHHGRASGRQQAVKRAAAPAGLAKQGGCETLRHRVATQRLAHGVHSRVRQARLGHADVQTTALDTPVMARDLRP